MGSITIHTILIFITFILPILITSLFLALHNFGVPGISSQAGSFGSLITVNTSKQNPIIPDQKAGSIINGVWYSLTFIASIMASYLLLFNGDKKPE